MWIAVHEATIANGTIQVIPDCFREALEHGRDPDSDHHIRCYPDESRAVPIELPAGGVAFFAYGTPHCTRGNTTDRDRAGVAYHFVQADHFQEDAQIRQGRLPDYHPVLSGPEATGGVKEYGVCVAGTWPEEVEQAPLR